MINPNELRIGNKVDHFGKTGNVLGIKDCFIPSTGETMMIVYVDVDGVEFDLPLTHIDPIPITTELLVKYGFVADVNGSYWIDYVSHYLELQICNDGVYPVYVQVPEMSSEDEQRVSLNRIEHLHHLQNLIFAITGEELKEKI